ncbi:MAG: phosphatase PAP2 family protein [Mariprofundaceae bacterium]|nr:phosphatase PAP2 family protein [Mariprofundaceae bacterium]
MLFKRWIIGSTLVLLYAITVMWNHEIFLWVNHTRSLIADQWIGVIGGLGDGLVVAVIMCVLMLANFRVGLAGVLAFLLSGLLAQILKRLFEAPRPPVVLDDVIVLGDSLSRHSFPSGHSASLGAMAVIFLLFYGYKRWEAWLAVALCAVGAYGRMYVGVHFPIDVLVGLSLGLLSSYYCWSYVHQKPIKVWENTAKTWYVIAALLLVLSAVLAFNYRVQPQTAQSMHWWVPTLSIMVALWLGKRRFAKD